MAMNIHQEARRKQMFMDRVCEARRRMALSQDEQQGGAGTSGGIQTDSVMCTDQGQFYQTRQEDGKEDHRYHRKCNFRNIPEDRVYPIMHPIVKNYRVPQEELPPRKPHFKV